VTLDELQSAFSKYGVIAEEIDSGAPRIKLYTEAETGKPKGDALIVYFRPESVQLAIQMLDDTDFRLGEQGTNGKMRVSEADWSYKKVKEVPDSAGAEKEGKAADAKAAARERQKIIKKSQKLNSKLADWDDDPSALTETSSRWDKMVVLKHMFTLEELEVRNTKPDRVI
jgi:HIV Tat-specific factor 1